MLAPLIMPMAIFTLLITLLAAAVLAVRTRLISRERVAISVNGRLELEAESGETLLETLAAHGVELPAACGGRGACGQCRVQLQGGSGELLPTEANHISRRDAAQGVRLACMVKVRGDLNVRVPEDVLQAQRLVCRVQANHNVSTYLKLLELELPADGRFAFEAGDYVLIEAPAGEIAFTSFDIDPDYREQWSRARLFEHSVSIPEPTVRAYSLANPPHEAGVLKLVVRIALPPPGAAKDVQPGKVSSFVYSLKAGDEVTVTGPFGEFHARRNAREMVFVGGGAGIAPMRAMILDELQRGAEPPRRISFWYGSRNRRELCFYDEFMALAAAHDNFSYHVALSGPDIESDWQGPTGLIHSVLYDQYLKDHACPEEAEYYLCGPPLMSSATLAMLEDQGVDRENVLFDDFGSA